MLIEEFFDYSLDCVVRRNGVLVLYGGSFSATIVSRVWAGDHSEDRRVWSACVRGEPGGYISGMAMYPSEARRDNLLGFLSERWLLLTAVGADPMLGYVHEVGDANDPPVGYPTRVPR